MPRDRLPERLFKDGLIHAQVHHSIVFAGNVFINHQRAVEHIVALGRWHQAGVQPRGGKLVHRHKRIMTVAQAEIMVKPHQIIMVPKAIRRVDRSRRQRRPATIGI